MYFAELDEKNIVKQVIVADEDYVAFQYGRFVKTDINGVSPKNYAGIGYKYDAEKNAFIPPKPMPSWVLTKDCLWKPPVDNPYKDFYNYRWDEKSLSWVKKQNGS